MKIKIIVALLIIFSFPVLESMEGSSSSDQPVIILSNEGHEVQIPSEIVEQSTFLQAGKKFPSVSKTIKLSFSQTQLEVFINIIKQILSTAQDSSGQHYAFSSQNPLENWQDSNNIYLIQTALISLFFNMKPSITQSIIEILASRIVTQQTNFNEIEKALGLTNAQEEGSNQEAISKPLKMAQVLIKKLQQETGISAVSYEDVYKALTIINLNRTASNPLEAAFNDMFQHYKNSLQVATVSNPFIILKSIRSSIDPYTQQGVTPLAYFSLGILDLHLNNERKLNAPLIYTLANRFYPSQPNYSQTVLQAGFPFEPLKIITTSANYIAYYNFTYDSPYISVPVSPAQPFLGILKAHRFQNSTAPSQNITAFKTQNDTLRDAQFIHHNGEEALIILIERPSNDPSTFNYFFEIYACRNGQLLKSQRIVALNTSELLSGNGGGFNSTGTYFIASIKDKNPDLNGKTERTMILATDNGSAVAIINPPFQYPQLLDFSEVVLTNPYNHNYFQRIILPSSVTHSSTTISYHLPTLKKVIREPVFLMPYNNKKTASIIYQDQENKAKLALLSLTSEDIRNQLSIPLSIQSTPTDLFSANIYKSIKIDPLGLFITLVYTYQQRSLLKCIDIYENKEVGGFMLNNYDITFSEDNSKILEQALGSPTPSYILHTLFEPQRAQKLHSTLSADEALLIQQALAGDLKNLTILEKSFERILPID